ncbi:malonyl-[acyl-carrier protein] O-methyltransferase BioC [Mannheimia granulomatis]|uniref:Malonyl-[acyl-carrier protein] O-methyltransferase n=1 Tax=Mannheimia granulomatis TaxID=85402 RepID=A0A6G8JF94_9PAST|nr:malonyl-ACP O-methyltransferase BioC [Mannheimia granulomatis]QIM65882.1 malonyl-[acyl-carrier protein] O-methyltransferase BioC [Mannheimia granulomatis]
MEKITALQIQKCFSAALNQYEQNATVQQQIAQKLTSLLTKQSIIQFDSCLEIGCGTGHLTRALNNQYQIKQWYIQDLCDCSSFLEKILPQGNFHFHQSNAELCPLDGKYHLVASASAVQWFHEKQLFIRHSASQLKANGILLFSTFAEHNLREIKQLTGIGLSYPSMNEWQQWLENDFDILQLNQEKIILELDSPKAVLQHLKSTGVTATNNIIWTKNTLQNFYHSYRENYTTATDKVSLTYEPLYCVAKKKEKEIK